jgi:O-acetyl-ADP-ribose deacetylase (regulator of RNase III)
MFVEIKGDATRPEGVGSKIIMHCCNDLGRFGSGFALSVAKQWPKVKDAYIGWYARHESPAGVEVTGAMGLGEAQLVQVGDELWVANIIGQHGAGMGAGGRAPIRYDALRRGLSAVHRWATIHKATVHAPRIGAGLAGGHWGNIKTMIQNEIINKGVPVTVYVL